MPTNEEMIAWLEEKIARDTEWLKHLEALDVDETRPSYSETKYNIGIYQAILAELELKMTEWTPDRPCPKEGAALAGPSEEERERLWRFVKPGLCGPLSMDDVINQRKLTQADIDEIRALILGHVAREGEKQ